MQELEKILEEIDRATDEYGMVDYINDEPVISKNRAKDIIRKHLSHENTPETTRSSRDNKCGECSRRKWYMKGYVEALKEDGVSEAFLEDCKRVAQKYKKDNGGWISVEERLPEESGYYRVTVKNKKLGDITEETAWFAYVDDYDMDESEWRELYEYEEVIAWRELAPYRPERSNDEKK